jgi:hypothetical protein
MGFSSVHGSINHFEGSSPWGVNGGVAIAVVGKEAVGAALLVVTVLGTKTTGRRRLDDGVNDGEHKQTRLRGNEEEENWMTTALDDLISQLMPACLLRASSRAGAWRNYNSHAWLPAVGFLACR